MHIALVLTTGEGGIPHYTAELANALAIDHEVSVVKPAETTADELFSADVSLEEWFENTGVSWSRIASLSLDPRRVLRGTLSYRETRRIDDLDPDVVHFTHQPHCYLRPLLPTEGFDVPVIQTRHDIFLSDNWLKLPGRDLPAEYDFLSPSTLAMSLDNVLRKVTTGVDADGYIVHTERNNAELARFKPDTPIATLPHGAFSVFGTDGREVEPDGNTVLCFGALRENKDILQLVEAAVDLRDDVEDLSVVIAGSGSIDDEARQTIRDNPELFEYRNEFVPNDEVSDLFARARVVAIPHTHQGGHSGTMTIAFAHGRPVVATTVGDYDELVRGEGAGFVVEPGDSTAMATALGSLLENDDLWATMSRRSGSVGDRLSWDNVADDTVAFYERCGAEN
jgi:glycosyltransferase involved in cell wall biosynthesis